MTPRPKSIGILSGNHLCRNPRVLKEASSLAHAGFEVEVLGAWTDSRLKAEDRELLGGAPFRFTAVVDETDGSGGSSIWRLTKRALSKGARMVFRAARLQSRWQLGPVVGALGRAARGRWLDLAIAHSESALAVVAELQQSGRSVGVDLEDWYSEDLLPEARRGRPVGLLRGLEERVLQSGGYASCPSHAMSEALAEAYHCSPPAVIYNAFPWADRASIDGISKDRVDRRRPSIHWYSQTLGMGRGLEDLLAALPFIRADAEVHLRGLPAEGFEPWLRARIPETWRARVFVHALVPNAELLSRIAEHDIGFAGEMKYCRSRDLTVTNKILHYLLAGLAVVASDTAGQREIGEQAGDAVYLYPSGNPVALGARLEELLTAPEALNRTRRAALRAAEARFCWERQEPVLLAAVQHAVDLRTT